MDNRKIRSARLSLVGQSLPHRIKGGDRPRRQPQLATTLLETEAPDSISKMPIARGACDNPINKAVAVLPDQIQLQIHSGVRLAHQKDDGNTGLATYLECMYIQSPLLTVVKNRASRLEVREDLE